MSLQIEPENQVIPLAVLQPGLATNNTNPQSFTDPSGTEAPLLRGTGARQDEQQANNGYGANFEDLTQEIFPFGFPILSQETPQVHFQQGLDSQSLNVKGVIDQLTAMYIPLIEFNATEEFDLFSKRPLTHTSAWVSTLQSPGLDPQKNIQHRFFVECYMIYLISPGFCPEGKFEPFPFWLRPTS